MKESYTLQEGTVLLGKIAPKTLRQWMGKAAIKAVQDKRDPRRWMLSRTQLEHLAHLHGRTLPPDTPAKSADPLPALERRIARLEQQLASAVERIAALETRPVATAPVRAQEPRQTVLPARPMQVSAPKRKAFTVDWRAKDWLEPHGIPQREMTDWHDIPLDTHANILAYAKERGHAPHRCRDEACPCLDLLD